MTKSQNIPGILLVDRCLLIPLQVLLMMWRLRPPTLIQPIPHCCNMSCCWSRPDNKQLCSVKQIKNYPNIATITIQSLLSTVPSNQGPCTINHHWLLQKEASALECGPSPSCPGIDHWLAHKVLLYPSHPRPCSSW